MGFELSIKEISQSHHLMLKLARPVGRAVVDSTRWRVQLCVVVDIIDSEEEHAVL
jgi:hypothetical protein